MKLRWRGVECGGGDEGEVTESGGFGSGNENRRKPLP